MNFRGSTYPESIGEEAQMTDPLLHLSTQDIVSAAIRDPGSHAQAMRLPCIQRVKAMSYLDEVQQAKAKRVALRTAPGGKDE